MEFTFPWHSPGERAICRCNLPLSARTFARRWTKSTKQKDRVPARLIFRMFVLARPTWSCRWLEFTVSLLQSSLSRCCAHGREQTVAAFRELLRTRLPACGMSSIVRALSSHFESPSRSHLVSCRCRSTELASLQLSGSVIIVPRRSERRRKGKGDSPMSGNMNRCHPPSRVQRP